MNEDGYHIFWVSWWHTDSMGSFNLEHPCWVSGHHGDDESYCAMLKVNYDEDVLTIVSDSYKEPPEHIEWRFVIPRPPGWTPNDRFVIE